MNDNHPDRCESIVPQAAASFAAEVSTLREWVQGVFLHALDSPGKQEARERFKQAFINLLFVHLYHLFEQQLALIAGYLSENRNYRFQTAREAYQAIFETCKVDVTFLPIWPKLDELRLIANTVKHSDASDSERLKKLRPDLFQPAGGLSVFRDVVLSNPVVAPMAGLHFYPTPNEYSSKAESVIQFWDELAHAVSSGNGVTNLRAWVFEKRAEVLALATKFGASNVRLFGSVARGDAGPNSDVDFLLDFAPGTSLTEEESIARELGELLGRKVDVASGAALKPRVRERAFREAIPL